MAEGTVSESLIWLQGQSDRVRLIRSRVRFHLDSNLFFVHVFSGCGCPSRFFVAVLDRLCKIDIRLLYVDGIRVPRGGPLAATT